MKMTSKQDKVKRILNVIKLGEMTELLAKIVGNLVK